jgi:protein-arginine kinase
MIANLLTCRTLGEACEMTRISRATLARWLKTARFQDALKAEQNAVIADATRRLLAGQNKALDRLEVLIDKARSEAVQRQSAVDWLTFTHRLIELFDIESRLAALERGSGIVN